MSIDMFFAVFFAAFFGTVVLAVVVTGDTHITWANILLAGSVGSVAVVTVLAAFLAALDLYPAEVESVIDSVLRLLIFGSGTAALLVVGFVNSSLWRDER